jgi:hypothetical protein
MVEVTVGGDNIIFNIRGLHKLWSFKRQLIIPRSNITRVKQDISVLKGCKGIKAPGTHIPGLIVAGTFRNNGKKSFWDVCKSKNAIVVDLKNEEYDFLIIEVSDPESVMDLITSK